MNHFAKTCLGMVATAALAACGSNSSSQNETAEVNAGANANFTADAATSPFSDSEKRMSDRMMAAVGSDVGDNWVRKMIEHHQGAIDMAQAVLQQNPKPDVAEMARMSIEKQRMDIADLRKLQKDGPPDQESADLYRSAMMDMQQKMQAASEADVSETFMRKMLEHHKGAIAMSDIALQKGVSGAVKAQIQKTRDDQQKDSKMLEAMLRGETMEHAMADSGATTPAEMAAKPKATEQAKKSSSGPTHDEHMDHDMNAMSHDMNHM